MRILLIHTGGTIGMFRTDSGFAPRQGIVEGVIQALMKTGDIAADVTILTLDPLIDSALATPTDWIRVANCIFEARDDHDAFVVTHGTDTLAYTAGALCLALPGLRKPVIVTGAMLPLTVDGTDGHRNLCDAFRAAEAGAPGIWVQFAGRLLHGARVRKSHSSSMDAFEAAPCLDEPLRAAPEPGIAALASHKVGVFSITPDPCTELLEFAAETCDGIILRCYGSGTAPDTSGLRAALGKARAREVPVIAVSQCSEGGIKLGTYAAGQVLRDNDVIDGRDMTPEMACVKMHFGLSQSREYMPRRAFLGDSQCGELTI